MLAAIWLVPAVRARAVQGDLQWLSEAIEKRSRALIVAIALASGVVATVWATCSPSGADASGYLSQAAMWAALDWRVPDALSVSLGWPLDAGDTAPLGWRPAVEPGWQVPTYAPGLPLLMAAPFALAGNAGASLIIVACAVLAVIATGALAHRFSGGTAGLTSAALVAGSPTFLYQSFQPMSDVPVTAAWMVALWATTVESCTLSGIATAVAVLIRPNLAPLAAVPLLWIICSTPAAGRWARLARVSIPVAAAAVLIALVQWRWYGSPLTSGYGSAGELFSFANVLQNARSYAAWMWEAERTFLMMAGVTLFGAVARRALVTGPVSSAKVRTAGNADAAVAASIAPGLAALCVFATGVVFAYLVYAVFERWSYVRFLLPALAAMSVVVGVIADRTLALIAPRLRGLLTAIAVAAVVASGVGIARRLEVFWVAEVHARAVEAGAQLRRVLPENAVLLAGEQSGSLRHETGRPVVRWESLDAPRLRAAIAALRALRLEPWWALDQWEESLVRSRFRDVPEAALDWPFEVEGGPLMRTRAWRVPDIDPAAADRCCGR